MSDDEGYDEPDCACIGETAKAVLVLRKSAVVDALSAMESDAPAEVWVPKSMLHDDSEIVEEGDEGTLIVKERWAEKQGWL